MTSAFHAFVRRLAAVALTLSPIAVFAAATYAFQWPGTYDLVGTGFSNGTRYAVLQIGRRDTTYTVTALEGPPGGAVSLKINGDTARILWNLGTGEPPMYVELLGAGDSVAGRWTMGALSGLVGGHRR